MPTPQERQIAESNLTFLTDPAGYLQTHLLDCGTLLERSIQGQGLDRDQLAANHAPRLQFDLVPLAYGKLGLQIRSRLASRTAGLPVAARFLGFRYNVSGPGQMAWIAADDSCPLIFTVGLTGCSIVGVRRGGELRFYHEPTRAEAPGRWLDQYPGDLVLHAAPSTGFGSAIMHCHDGKHWRVYVQSFTLDEGAMSAAAAGGGRGAAQLYRFYTLAGLTVVDET